MQLYETLVEQLKKENNFVTDDGKLKKWVVIEKARQYDPVLIKLLLSNETLKDRFFIDADGVLVFKKDEFITFMEMKNYLNDSYTQFKNKIGLTIDGKYLKQRNEVALVWPYKDCVLEGGQTKEEQKREEIFFNEILAQDEITQLFEPKVLTNGKHYDINEEKPFEKFTRDAELNRKRGLPEDTITDNLIIKGNNLLALHSIEKQFAGKIKMIYIDPPYYFSKKNKNLDSFGYNTRFKLSTWLTFMKNRLEEGKKLLSKDGIIFISIDDGGMAHLKVLMDEIFGYENFISTLPTIMNLKGNNDEFGFAGTHEYTIVYAKNKSNLRLNEFEVDEEEIFDEWEEDEIGYFKKGANLKATGENAPREKRPNLFYPIFLDKNGNLYVTDNNKKLNKDDIEILPLTNGTEMSWRWSKDKVRKETYNLIPIKNGNNVSIYKKQRPNLADLPTKKPKTIFYKPEYSSGNGTNQIKALFGKKIFKNPKPIELIKDFVRIGSNKNDIILDFFSGSGTTGHAVLSLNQEDGGNRKFILIDQLDEHIKITYERTKKVINNEKLNEKVIYMELKKFNEYFLEQILNAADTEELLNIWEEMKKHSFIDYNLDIKKQEEHMEEFKKLELEKQKQHLIDILDKNQLYVNLSYLNDDGFGINEMEKKLTKDFYAIKD